VLARPRSGRGQLKSARVTVHACTVVSRYPDAPQGIRSFGCFHPFRLLGRLPVWAATSHNLWSRPAIALGTNGEPIRFCVTHLHPLRGQTYDLVAQNQEFGEHRVFYRDAEGRIRYLPARWTSLASGFAG